jgi:hypothetical protein
MTMPRPHKLLSRSLSFSPGPVAPPDRLSGVRLGRVERSLLIEAPGPWRLCGMLIDAPEQTRSAQETYLRAARKLRSCGLVDLADVRQVRRANDPRRAEPFYRAGCFWLRPDSTRRHVVKRKVLWLTSFGEGIKLEYEHELRSGSPIRWTKHKVARAARHAERHPLRWADRVAAIDQMTADLSCADGTEPDPDGAVEFVPDFVASAEELERWRLAVRSAGAISPQLSSGSLYREACALYASAAPIEELRAAALSAGQARTQHDRTFQVRFRCDPLSARMRSTGGAAR